jgi:hypothetical protein
MVTAGLLASVIRGNRPSEPGPLPRDVLSRLRIISACGLPFMILGGLWSGLAAALLGVDQGSAADYAIALYQFTFLAAAIADGITLVAAITTRAVSQK